MGARDRNPLIICILLFAVCSLQEGFSSHALQTIKNAAEAKVFRPRRGVQVQELRFDKPRAMVAHLVKVDLTTPGIGFVATERDPMWGRPMPDYTNELWLVNTKRETTVDFMERRRAAGENVEIAFNTSGWRPWGGRAATDATYAALYRWDMTDGRELSCGKEPGRGTYFIVRKDGGAFIRSGVEPGMTNDWSIAVYGNRPILENGRRVNAGIRTAGPPDLAPRLALGLSPDQKTLVILAVDGRQSGLSEGATCADLADILLREGCTDAVNMDGGGSTSLVVWDSASSSPKMLNSHADGYRRRVAVNLGIVFDEGNGGVIADFLSKSAEERIAIFADLAEKSKFRNVVPRPEDGPPRFMSVDGVSNMRDIGGWKGLGGRPIRHGLVYRSAAFDTGARFRRGGRAQYEYLFGLDPVTEEEKRDFKPSERTITDKGVKELVDDLGIRTDLDLRSPHECHGMDSSPLGRGVKWAHCPLKTYGRFGDEDAKAAFAKAFKVFLDESNYPIVFHCAGGADRTGAVAFMVMGVCGVALDDLRKDWELTAFGTGHAENPGFTHAKRFDCLVAVVDAYPGETLADRIAAYIKSCGFTDADIERVREIMLSPEDGVFAGARWIRAPEGLGAAAPRFTTKFKTERAGPAEIAICGLGQYVATLNGKPLGRGDEFNLPGWTKTSKTCFYNVFHPSLEAGAENTLEITLGNGMYNVEKPAGDLYTKFVASEGEKKLLVGGAVKSSPEGWNVSASEVVRTHVYSGDDIDRTADVSRSMSAVAAVAPKGVLREAPFVCRLQEAKRPVETMRVSDEEWTVDFAQNAAYVPTVVARGPRGSGVEVEFAEMPLPEGVARLPEVATTHRKGGVTRCCFTLAGTGGDETFTTPFFYYGFRYMRVRLLPAREGGERPAFVSAAARVVMADMPAAGSFECSIGLFNKIYEICRWAQRSNMQSVFTDCPHREKLGWQEQDHIHAGQIRWGWNAEALFAKTCMDAADSQLENGLCTCIAPEFTVFSPKFRDSIEWGSSIIQIPWQQYEWTGDDSLIRKYWPNMAAYHDYIRSQARGFIARGALGDWCQETAGGARPVRKTSAELTATAFYYRNAATLAKCAGMLGKNAEAAEYRAEAENIKKAFNAKWWRPDIHGYENNSQTANSIALAFGIAVDAWRDRIVSNIVEDVRGRGNAVGTGEIGYPYLLEALRENGRDDVIFDMAIDDTKPGYGWMIAKGNTSCHEAWDARADLSHNHFMMADIVDWFYGSLAGIRRTSPGFKTFVVEPKFLPGLDWVKASHSIAGGEIKVEWKRRGEAIDVFVAVPPGAEAAVRLPGLGETIQTPGEKTYVVESRAERSV